MIKDLPSYEALLVELHGTLESLVMYGNSRTVRDLAQKRMDDIENIRKTGGGFHIANHFSQNKQDGQLPERPA